MCFFSRMFLESGLKDILSVINRRMRHVSISCYRINEFWFVFHKNNVRNLTLYNFAQCKTEMSYSVNAIRDRTDR